MQRFPHGSTNECNFKLKYSDTQVIKSHLKNRAQKNMANDTTDSI